MRVLVIEDDLLLGDALQAGLRACGLPVAGWEHRWIAQTACPLQDPEVLRACLRMLDVLEELDDVRSVTANLEADEDLMELPVLYRKTASSLAVARESEQQNWQFKTEDFKEGVAAMAARREPVFKGE